MFEIIWGIGILFGWLVSIGSAMLADRRGNVVWHGIPCLYSLLFNFMWGVFNGRGLDIFITVFYAAFLLLAGWAQVKIYEDKFWRQ